MSEQGPLTRHPSHAGTAPSMAELLDPVALEERLRDARARRAAVLAQRPQQGEGASAAPLPVRGASAAPIPGRALRPAEAAPGPAATGRSHAEPARHLRVLPDRPEHAAPPAKAQAGPAPLAAPVRRTARRSPRMRFGRKVLFAMFSAGCGLGAVTAVLALGAFGPDGGGPEAAPMPERVPTVETAALPPEPASPAALVEDPLPAPAALDVPVPEVPAPRAAVETGAPAALDPPPAAETPPPEALPEPAAEPRPVAAAGPPALDPEAVRVFIHLPSSLTVEAVAGGIAALQDAGLETVDMVPIDIPIGRSNLRYYHPEDRAAAEEIAAALGASLPGGPVAVRDFTDFRPPPRSGRIEVWVAGQPAAGPVAPAAMTVPALANALAPGVTAQIERLLLELGGR